MKPRQMPWLRFWTRRIKVQLLNNEEFLGDQTVRFILRARNRRTSKSKRSGKGVMVKGVCFSPQKHEKPPEIKDFCVRGQNCCPIMCSKDKNATNILQQFVSQSILL